MTTPEPPQWSLSIVSHGHWPRVLDLLSDCARLLDPSRHEMVLTLDVPESVDAAGLPWQGPLRLIRNQRSQSFGANHNAALAAARGRYVALLDPDLRLSSDPFPRLASALEAADVGVVATRVREPDGCVADHARPLPTPRRLLARHVGGARASYSPELSTALDVDWVAGLFMGLRRTTWQQLGGFDPRYRLYCEDVDLCLRAWNASLRVQVVPGEWVLHPPRRRTLRSSQHFYRHCASLLRLWRSAAYREFRHRHASS
ncbi:glycosyltransferase [Panacagrimonas sp.]|uniref:glycosyltransferase n=1 Tax=Panacagrimonas sp. TaxID=2480088 RepID=UPI003B52E26E